MKKKSLKWTQYKFRFLALLKNPFFWILTAIGNSIILFGAILLYIFEAAAQHSTLEFIDCLLWSTGTVTTIGYGNYMPVTMAGKCTLLLLMLLGTFFVWSYMAYLVTGLLTPELTSLERDVHEVEKEIQAFKNNP